MWTPEVLGERAFVDVFPKSPHEFRVFLESPRSPVKSLLGLDNPQLRWITGPIRVDSPGGEITILRRAGDYNGVSALLA